MHHVDPVEVILSRELFTTGQWLAQRLTTLVPVSNCACVSVYISLLFKAHRFRKRISGRTPHRKGDSGGRLQPEQNREVHHPVDGETSSSSQ